MPTNNNSPASRRICLTCGDPAGIGPELVATALPHILASGRQPLVIMPAALLERAQELTGHRIPVQVAPPNDRVPADHAHLWFPEETSTDIPPGEVSRAAGRIARLALESGVKLVREQPSMPLVTAPVNKQSLRLDGFSFPGQTEFLGARDGNRKSRMIMYHTDISTILATIHLPLQQVSAALTIDLLLETISDYYAFLQHLGRRETITVLALNPHASENGLFGDEENNVISPAIAQAAAAGIPVRGPISADTAFSAGGCFVALYHDQGMIPFKLVAGWAGVNVTWGLSFIRTSPDHGTAFPIAWRNQADPASMLAAVNLAMRLTP